MEESADPPSPHLRRPRYRGTHPRRYADKYKELDPARDPETLAKVIASGKTPAGMHLPVMVEEILAFLDPRPGQTGVDATLGYGGHAEKILPRLQPGGRLFGMDVDPVQLPRTSARLQALGFPDGVFLAVKSNFAGLSKVVVESGPLNFLLADLGCSSMQIDDPGRGFTFKSDGPLDMRMNPDRGIAARAWLQRQKAESFATTLRDNADEENAEILAPALAGQDIATTTQLVTVIRHALGNRLPEDALDHTVRRVFQAIRIAVNDEFGALNALLRALPDAIVPGGRVAILTFHSGEDRRVKKAFQLGMRSGIWKENDLAPQTASPAERRSNPRSIAAKLRVVEKAE